MRRNNRKSFNEEKESKKLVTLSLSVLIIAVIAFIVTFVVYRNYLNRQASISQYRASLTDLSKTNKESSSQVSSNMGKTVNEMQESTNTVTNEVQTDKIAINTSNMEKEKVNKVEPENSVTTTNNVEKPKEEPKKEVKVPDPTFIKPVEGELMVEFAKDNLVYSNTLQEWVTHNGVDIKADKTTIVKAAAEGTVKSIKNDPRYGITVVIEHVNGYSTIYANLLTAEFIKEKETVKQGQTIGTVGNTATFEIADEPHLHFEILKDSENLDPSSFIF